MGVPVLGISQSDEAGIILIEPRSLIRECISESLQRASGCNVFSVASADRCLELSESAQVCLVVLCTGGLRDGEVSRALSVLAKLSEGVPLALISDEEDPERIVKAFEAGVRGVISTSLSLAVAVEAMRLVRVGGTYIPASCLTAGKHSVDSKAASEPTGNGMFTSRQAAVIEALRKGKANKIIAYELDMRESTVKVHVRNIMKKLNARNRTEVAFITNGMMAYDRH